MSLRQRYPLIGMVVLWLTALCVPVLAEFEYERLAEFQPPVYRYWEITTGSDGYAYSVSYVQGGPFADGLQRILRLASDGTIDTYVYFGLQASLLTDLKPWLVLGHDGLLYGEGALINPFRRVVYRVNANREVEILGDGDFALKPVVGADGNLYGWNSLTAGICRFRAGQGMEVVPGTVDIRSWGSTSVTTDVNGVVYFTAGSKIWKIGENDASSEVADFSETSPLAATFGTSLDSTLLRGKSGAIYGRTQLGATGNSGAIFRISQTGSLAVIATYGNSPGQVPTSSLPLKIAEGGNGHFYLVHYLFSGERPVYAIKPDGKAENIGTVDSTASSDGLATGSDQEAYWAACSATEPGKRLIYHLSLQTGCTVVGSAPANDPLPGYPGELIAGAPVIGPDGGLWATTAAPVGSDGHFSHLIRLSPDGSFSDRQMVASDGLPGENPSDLRVVADGSITGIGRSGQGLVVFRIRQDGSPEYRGIVGSHIYPAAPVQFEDGSLVGVSCNSGMNRGAFYRLAPDGSQSNISFHPPGDDTLDGPAASLVRWTDGAWYGTTRLGWARSFGSIFKISPSFELQTQYEFGANVPPSPNGVPTAPSEPAGSFFPGKDGALYTVVARGGQFPVGGLVRYEPGAAPAFVASFPEYINSGSNETVLTEGTGGWFYGVSCIHSINGTDGLGFVFRVNKLGNFENLGHFTGSDGKLPGSQPVQRLIAAPSGVIYGMATFGGLADHGVVFQISPDGLLETIASFTGTSGSLPGSDPRSLIVRGHVLYGICSRGGTYNAGTLFRIDQAKQGSLVHTFNPFDEVHPSALPSALVLGPDGHMYGASGSNAIYPTNIVPGEIHGSVFRVKVTNQEGPADDQVELPVNHFDPLANDGFDFAAKLPTLTSVTQGQHGKVTLHADGTVSYQPSATFTGTDSFTYTVKSDSSIIGSATVTVRDTGSPEVVSFNASNQIEVGANGMAILPDYTKFVKWKDLGGSVSITQSPAPETLLGVGEHEVRLTLTDPAGNSTPLNFLVFARDITPPMIVVKPSDRTIVRAGVVSVFCPDLLSETNATDNVGILIRTQTPAAGTALSDGYTRVKINVSDGGANASCECVIRVVRAVDFNEATGEVVPGLEQEHHYVSFGSPALAADGTIAYTAKIKPMVGSIRTALFRRRPGQAAVPVILTGAVASETETILGIGEPVINAGGTIAFEAKLKSTNGAGQSEAICITPVDGPVSVLAKSGEAAPIDGTNAVLREFNDVSLLDSGSLLVHATIGANGKGEKQRALWLVAGDDWKLLLQTGVTTMVGVSAVIVRDFSYGILPAEVGAQSRSFNSSGQLALRLRLADKREVIARILPADGGVTIQPLVISSDEWRNLGTPAIDGLGAVVFRATHKFAGDSKSSEVIVRVPEGADTLDLIARASSPYHLGDPAVSASGDVVFSERGKFPNSQRVERSVQFWSKEEGGLFSLHDGVETQRGTGAWKIERVAISDEAVLSQAHVQLPPPGAVKRAVMRTTSGNALLQTEGELALGSDSLSDRLRQIDFLTPVPGVGGQTRAFSSTGWLAYRVKLSGGRTGIIVLAP